jgi:hypothetical protein
MSGPPSLLDYLDEPDLDRFAEVVADLLMAGTRRITPAEPTTPADDAAPAPAAPRSERNTARVRTGRCG